MTATLEQVSQRLDHIAAVASQLLKLGSETRAAVRIGQRAEPSPAQNFLRHVVVRIAAEPRRTVEEVAQQFEGQRRR